MSYLFLHTYRYRTLAGWRRRLGIREGSLFFLSIMFRSSARGCGRVRQVCLICMAGFRWDLEKGVGVFRTKGDDGTGNGDGTGRDGRRQAHPFSPGGR